MAKFQQTFLSWHELLKQLANVYIWIVGLTSLAAVFRAKASAAATASAPTPSPSNYSLALTSSHCSPEELWAKMDIWLRWMTTLLVISLILAYYAKRMVDTAAALEARLYSNDNDDYKALCNLRDQAEVYMNQARADASIYEDARNRWSNAKDRAERAKPKEGLARCSTWSKRWMRGYFISAICFSFGAGLCALVAFYLSLEMSIGCTKGAAEIIPFVFIGAGFLSMHLETIFVAATAN